MYLPCILPVVRMKPVENSIKSKISPTEFIYFIGWVTVVLYCSTRQESSLIEYFRTLAISFCICGVLVYGVVIIYDYREIQKRFLTQNNTIIIGIRNSPMLLDIMTPKMIQLLLSHDKEHEEVPSLGNSLLSVFEPEN